MEAQGRDFPRDLRAIECADFVNAGGPSLVAPLFFDIGGMENSDVTETPRAAFMGACLDYLEGETTIVPDPTHLSPEDQSFIRWWLTSLGRTRDTLDMLAALADRASAKGC